MILNEIDLVQNIDEYRAICKIFSCLSSVSPFWADPFSLLQSVTLYHILGQYKHAYKLPSQLTGYFYRIE